MNLNSKIFRLFISSTFDDFRLERDALQIEVFPYLEDICKKAGFSFLPIDLRWGVSNEAQLDQRTLELCLHEVNACSSNPHPDFLIFAGDRYGWIPLPYLIEKDEFEKIYSYIVDESEKTLINHWYHLDTNQIPVSYALQKRENEYEDYDTWSKVESSLRTLLQNGVQQTNLDTKTKEEYFTSATEFEFQHYLNQINQIDSINSLFAVDRTITTDLSSSKYFDHNPKLKSFKEKIKKHTANEHYLQIPATLKDQDSLDSSHIALFTEKLKKVLGESFTKEIKRISSLNETISEADYQKYHLISTALNINGKDKIIGRNKEIEEIVSYTKSDLNRPFVIYGPSGMGKSSLVAKTIQTLLKKSSDKKVVYRFCGISPASLTTKSLLSSILVELGVTPPKIVEKENISLGIDSDKKEQIDEFESLVYEQLKAIEEDIIIVIDALDQLSDNSKLDWLPITLPSNIKIILSVLDDVKYQDDSYYYQKLKEMIFDKTSFYQIKPLEDRDIAKEILKTELSKYNRSITSTQQQYILDLYDAVRSPFYLIIIAQEARYWSSDKIDLSLSNTQQGSVKEFIENLTKVFHHDEQFVQKVFGYTFASQYTINESLLYEILSNDDELLQKVENKFHVNLTKKLPSAVFSRLLYQMTPFIKLDENGNIKFFHREFIDGAKSCYSVDISQKLLSIIEKMLQKSFDSSQNNTEENQQQSLTKLYADIIANQQFNYEKSDISKQVKYIVSQSNNNEKWVNKILSMCHELSFEYSLSTKDKWAIAYRYSALKITETLYIKNPQQWAELYTTSLNNLATSYKYQDRDDEAIQLEEKALKIREALCIENPLKWAEDYTTSLNNLATSYSNQDRALEAIELQEKALEITETLYNEVPQHFAEAYTRSLNNLATSYKYQDRPLEAIELLEKALKITETLYIENPLKWAEAYTTALNNLATSYKYQEKALEAIELEEKALKIREALYIENPLKWAEAYTVSLNNLATSYKYQDRPLEAIELLEKALKITETLYIENSQRWAELYTTALNNLATSYSNQDRALEAIEVQEKALKIREALYIENPLKWAEAYTVSLNNLATSYKYQEKALEAIELEEKALKIREALYIKNPLKWAEAYTTALNNLATSYKYQDRPLEAIELEEKALKIREALYIENPLKWAEAYTVSLNNLATSYKYQDRPLEAIELLEKALKITETLYIENPLKWAKDYTRNLINLATSYKYQDRPLEAIQLLEKALKITEALYIKNPLKWAELYTTSLNSLVTLYNNQNRALEAIELEEKALKIIEALYIDNTQQWAEAYIICINKLAISYIKQGKVHEAMELQEKDLKIREALYIQNPQRWAEDYTRSLINLATSYSNQNRDLEAIELEEKALKIREILYIENPLSWAEYYTSSLINLATSYSNQNRDLETIELEEKALKITEALYKENPQRWAEAYTTTLINLATSYKNQYRVLEAIQLEEKALKNRETLYKESPQRWAEDYTRSLNNLANSLRDLEEYERAIELEKECLKIEMQMGTVDVNTNVSRIGSIGHCYLKLRDYQNALKYFRDYFEIFTPAMVDTIENIVDFIYPFVKYYQSTIRNNHNPNSLDLLAHNFITSFKERFESSYDNQITIEHEGYMDLKDSDDPLDNEKYEIFCKVFIGKE